MAHEAPNTSWRDDQQGAHVSQPIHPARYRSCARNRSNLTYRDVLHEKITASEAGTEALRAILYAPPAYGLPVRCLLAFFSASVIYVVSFGGSLVDMSISGLCTCCLQYFGWNAAHKRSMYANVYEEAALHINDLVLSDCGM